MDALKLLKDDHKTIEELFKRFEKTGDRAHAAKRQIADRLVEELSVHAAIEEQLLYPVVRATIPDAETEALEALEEHHVVKWLLYEIEMTDPADERFDAKMSVLMEMVRHHVKEEESELFPKVREELGRTLLAELGDEMDKARRLAPTKPHPRSSDAPPGNLVMGAAAGVADRISDTVSGLAQGSVSAAGDFIDRVLRRNRRRPAARGSSVARSTADMVRARASDVTDSAVDTAKTAARAGREVREAAGATASRNARTAVSHAESTTTAKATGATKSKGSTARRSSPARSAQAKSASKRRTKAASGSGRRPATKSTAKRVTKRTAKGSRSSSSR